MKLTNVEAIEELIADQRRTFVRAHVELFQEVQSAKIEADRAEQTYPVTPDDEQQLALLTLLNIVLQPTAFDKAWADHQANMMRSVMPTGELVRALQALPDLPHPQFETLTVERSDVLCNNCYEIGHTTGECPTR